MSWRFCTRIYARCPRSTETPLISPANCLYPVHSSGEASKFYLYNWKFQRWCGPWSLCIWISLNEFLVHDSCTLYVLLMEVHDLVSFFLKNQAITPSLKMLCPWQLPKHGLAMDPANGPHPRPKTPDLQHQMSFEVLLHDSLRHATPQFPSPLPPGDTNPRHSMNRIGWTISGQWTNLHRVGLQGMLENPAKKEDNFPVLC